MNIVELLFRKDKSSGRDKAIVVRSLYNRYNGKRFLNNISFMVYKGEIFSVIGLSGSGKSTLLKAITGLIRSKGEIRIFGRPPFLSRKEMGFCPQEDSFVPNLTVKENIELFSELYGGKDGIKRGKEYLKLLELDSKINFYPKNLSGGQRKRLNIVLSCLHNPKLLILDEPFAGLDYYNRKILWDFLTGLRNKGTTILLTTHLLEEAQKYSSRVLILKNGSKFAYGTFSEIKHKIRFNYIYHIKINNLSNKFMEMINHYALLKGFKVVYRYKGEVQFALNSENERITINNFLKRNKKEFTELYLRKPNLDEVMLASK